MSGYHKSIIFIACVAVSCSFAVFRHRIALLHVQYLCASHTDPAGTIAFEGSVASAKRLLREQPREYVFHNGAVRLVQDWDRYARLVGVPITDSEPGAIGFGQLKAPGIPFHDSAIFLHALSMPCGRRVIVAIGVDDFPDITSVVVEPAGIMKAPRVLRASHAHLAFGTRKVFDKALLLVKGPRIFTGHADAADPSSFLFICEIYGVKADVRGRLSDDGSVTVKLQNDGELRTRLREVGFKG